ncbi:MAG: CocE/NonD family hydrolase, partial [Acidobacteria bacterium]|nr:CocE/NonD family hydrolase [Acidobacteriota bacterium]
RPDGASINIAEGILRARFRNGVSRMELLEANKTYDFPIDMTGTANVFLPGHRIRVLITSSNFPQFDRNPNTGKDLGVSAETRVARQTIRHSSRIVLPVVEVP